MKQPASLALRSGLADLVQDDPLTSGGRDIEFLEGHRKCDAHVGRHNGAEQRDLGSAETVDQPL